LVVSRVVFVSDWVHVFKNQKRFLFIFLAVVLFPRTDSSSSALHLNRNFLLRHHSPPPLFTTMAKKKASDIHQRSPSPPSDDTKFVSPLEIPSVEKHDRVPVKVNNASMTELKLACDDSLKRVRFLLSSPLISSSLPRST
jgi:hypothetical protein